MKIKGEGGGLSGRCCNKRVVVIHRRVLFEIIARWREIDGRLPVTSDDSLQTTVVRKSQANLVDACHEVSG